MRAPVGVASTRSRRPAKRMARPPGSSRVTGRCAASPKRHSTPTGARIVDYKTGKGSSEEKRLRDGLSVQLPVYQLAVRQAGGGDYGEISCLYRLVTRRGGFGELLLPDGEEVAGRRLRDLVAQAVALVDAGLFPRSTAGRCDYCDVGYACGATDWTRARKREHELLEDLVSLQRYGPKEASDDAGA